MLRVTWFREAAADISNLLDLFKPRPCATSASKPLFFDKPRSEDRSFHTYHSSALESSMVFESCNFQNGVLIDVMEKRSSAALKLVSAI